MFSVPLVRQVALPGSYPAHCPQELGLSSPRLASFETHRAAIVWTTTTFRLSRTHETEHSASDVEPNLNTNGEQRTWKREPLSVNFLLDPVLFELLVKIAAGRVNHLGGLRDVPVVFAELLYEVRPLGGVLELTQGSARRRVA